MSNVHDPKLYQTITTNELFTVRVCKLCGALVHYDKRYQHSKLHETIDAATVKEIQDAIPGF